MRRAALSAVAVCAIIGALAVSVLLPWWAVWLICAPVVYFGIIGLIKINSKDSSKSTILCTNPTSLTRRRANS